MVIGITSVKAGRDRGRHWRARAFRHYPGFNSPGEIPPGISGYTTTLSRLFRGSQRLSASNPGNFRVNSALFVTDSHGGRHRPRPRLFRRAGRLLRAPFRPAAGRLAQPACLAVRPRGHPLGQAGAGRRSHWRTDMRIHAEGHDRKINTRDHLPGTPTDIVLRAVRVYIVWEFARRFIPGAACAFTGSGGYRCRQVYVKEYGIAGAKERPPVCREPI